MKPEHWQQLDKLFHSVLEREPAERAAFLDEACAGDESLRKRVEALLAADGKAGSFIESPAMEVEARGVAADPGNTEAELGPGKTVSHYRIISPLGSGGMGDVYLAQDTVLSRQVALKLLPEDFTRDRDRLRRFQQEARAASALNHPNIITIYEIGQVDNRHFIATEFIDGTTLRQNFFGEGRHASGKASRLREVLDIAIQTVDALAAAHDAGIVHRDIKPENIMVRRRDGYVKVLDFGLAKLTEGAVDTEAPTRAKLNTSAGVVMGTASYMSPEQARGEQVDARTDIWSLGVVLFEMVAGSAPFERSTPSEIIALILEREPPPLARYAREVPPELERIVNKALTKDREERYQTAKDVLIDLRWLRQQLEVKAEVERLATPASGQEVAATTDGTPATVATTDEAAARTQAEMVRPTSSAEYLLSGIKRHKQGTVVALAISFVLLGGIGFGLYKFVIRSRPGAAPFQATKVTPLITKGIDARLPSISPDGKYVAYVAGAAGQQSLWINQVATTSDVEIIPPAEVQYGRPNFSHDGSYVYYVVGKKGDPQGTLYRIPVLGGTPRKLLVNIQSVISLSPDDKRFAFYRSNPEEGEELLIVANADGSGEQKLALRKGDEWFEFGKGADQGPAWSPDGKVIACGAGTGSRGRLPATVIVVQVADGAQKEFTSQRWSAIGTLAWLRDGSGLMLSAVEQPNPSQILHLSYPGGEARQITDAFRGFVGPSLTADSSTMVAMQWDQLTNIWVAPGGDASRARQITSSNKWEGAHGLSWTPDGKIVYFSRATGNADIWIMDQDGSHQEQLTVDAGINKQPSVTADGRYIVFVSNRAGKWSNIWRMDTDGGHPKQLTNGIEDLEPHCSPDSRWVVYSNANAAKTTLWKVSIDGGNPVQLTNRDSSSPVVSPDGKWIACRYVNKQSDSPDRIAVIPFEGGEPTKLFDLPPVRWTSDGRALTYVERRGGVSNIWSQSLDGGPAKRLTDFKDNLLEIWDYDWSHDGKQLVCVRDVMVPTIVLISDFK
jgi:serine/threonine protein kinase/Tol biopolymer transport system component